MPHSPPRSPGAPALREAVAADAPGIAALIRLAFAQQSVMTDPPPSARLETAESVAAHFHRGGGGVVAGDGVAALLWEARDGGLDVKRLSVHPEWRRLGLARRLLAAAEAAARGQGLTVLRLSTRLVLQDNRRLFAACGFRETAQHAHAGYASPTFVDMEKRLT